MTLDIGIAGPVTLRLLRGFEQEAGLPLGYGNPPMSAFVNAFLDRGHKVTVFTTSTDLHSPLVFRRPGVTVCVARRQPHAARCLFHRERKDLKMLMNEHPVEVLNAHWSYEFAWAALDSGMPTLVTLRDHAFSILKHNRDAYRFMRLIMNQYVVSRAPFLSTNSRYLFERLAARYQRKGKVIHNLYSADIGRMHSSYDNRDNCIISVANGFGHHKNIKTALHAFAILRKAMPSVKYQLIGSHMEARGEAERYARRAGIAEGVEFLGAQSHERVLDLVRSAKLMLHPSFEESFGMSVLEAMVLGTPVVGGSHSGNIPSLLNNGEAGVLCDIRKPQEIADSVSRVLRDESYARRLAEAAAAFAKAQFSEDAVVASYLDYYSEILRKWRLHSAALE